MHPAYSVIFFTTASGAGYGLLIWLGVFGPLGWVPQTSAFGLVGLGLALLLITGGLLSSTAHLGRPERAWRALSQWRSSWLSREGVAAIVTYVPAVYVVVQLAQGRAAPLAGVVLIVACGVTLCCTAQIYRSLKTVRAWHNGWTLPGYLLQAAWTGTALAWLFGTIGGRAPIAVVVLLPTVTAIVAAYQVG